MAICTNVNNVCIVYLFQFLRNFIFPYFNDQGEEISRSTDGCTGNICRSGQIIHWDDPCVIDPPFCPGTEEKLPGQCCPICHITTPEEPFTLPSLETTTPRTTTQETTAHSDICFYAGKFYLEGNYLIMVIFNPI